MLALMARIPRAELEPVMRVMGQAFAAALKKSELQLSEAAGILDLNVAQLHRQIEGREPLCVARIVKRMPRVFVRWSALVGRSQDVQDVLAEEGMSVLVAALLAKPGEARMARAEVGTPSVRELRHAS